MIKKALGDKIRYYRKQAGMSQEKLSFASGITLRYFQDLEAGRFQPTVTTLFKLAGALGIEPGDLVAEIYREWLRQGKPED